MKKINLAIMALLPMMLASCKGLETGHAEANIESVPSWNEVDYFMGEKQDNLQKYRYLGNNIYELVYSDEYSNTYRVDGSNTYYDVIKGDTIETDTADGNMAVTTNYSQNYSNYSFEYFSVTEFIWTRYFKETTYGGYYLNADMPKDYMSLWLDELRLSGLDGKELSPEDSDIEATCKYCACVDNYIAGSTGTKEKSSNFCVNSTVTKIELNKANGYRKYSEVEILNENDEVINSYVNGYYYYTNSTDRIYYKDMGVKISYSYSGFNISSFLD